MMLDVCCGPCSTLVLEKLDNPTLFFPNSNIYPRKEYEKRLIQAKKMADLHGLKLIIPDYDHEAWLDYLRNEVDKLNVPEGQNRCMACYRYRLEKTAAAAKQSGDKTFTTTLTISPHKDAKKINTIGKEVAKSHGLTFAENDFSDGFAESVEMSKEHDLYRQKYCGCEFSMR